MPRGSYRRQAPDVQQLEAEIQRLQERQRELRQQLRRMRHSGTEIHKLEEKLTTQLATAKWTVRQIKELNPDWDEWAFYRSVEAREPPQRTWRRQRKEQGQEAAGNAPEQGILQNGTGEPEGETPGPAAPRRGGRRRAAAAPE